MKSSKAKVYDEPYLEDAFLHLNEIGVLTHHPPAQHARAVDPQVEIIPLKWSCATSRPGLSTRLGIDEGTQLPRSIIGSITRTISSTT